MSGLIIIDNVIILFAVLFLKILSSLLRYPSHHAAFLEISQSANMVWPGIPEKRRPLHLPSKEVTNGSWRVDNVMLSSDNGTCFVSTKVLPLVQLLWHGPAPRNEDGFRDVLTKKLLFVWILSKLPPPTPNLDNLYNFIPITKFTSQRFQKNQQIVDPVFYYPKFHTSVDLALIRQNKI